MMPPKQGIDRDTKRFSRNTIGIFIKLMKLSSLEKKSSIFFCSEKRITCTLGNLYTYLTTQINCSSYKIHIQNRYKNPRF